jgi:hypothetical protein
LSVTRSSACSTRLLSGMVTNCWITISCCT